MFTDFSFIHVHVITQDESDLEEEIDDIMASTDMLSAGDTIVLEFAPLKSSKKPISTSHRCKFC